MVKAEQEAAERELDREKEERKRKQEEQKRKKRMLEAAFDGDVGEMENILREVRIAFCKRLNLELQFQFFLLKITLLSVTLLLEQPSFRE